VDKTPTFDDHQTVRILAPAGTGCVHGIRNHVPRFIFANRGKRYEIELDGFF